MISMELSKNVLEHIKQEAERVHHGRIIIELNATANKIDVVTESRERFNDNKKNS